MQLCQMSTHFSEVHHLQQPSVSLSVRPWRLALRGLPLRRGLFVVEVLDSSWRCWTPAAGVRSARWTCLSSWPQRLGTLYWCCDIDHLTLPVINAGGAISCHTRFISARFS